MEQTSFLQLILFAFLLLFQDSQSNQLSSCPWGCTCSAQTISCRRAGLTAIPRLPKTVPAYGGGVLQYLLVTDNPIIRLEGGSFFDQPDLIQIELSFDQLVWVSKEAFIGLPSLRSLSLKGNRIANLPHNIFTPLFQLEELDLSGNELTDLPFSLEGLIYLKRLALSGNPLNCPCELVDFSITLSYIEPSDFRVTCRGPSEIAGMRLADLGQQLFEILPNTRLLGYQAANDSDREELLRVHPYVPSENSLRQRWPWLHCPVEDFGGHRPKQLIDRNEKNETISLIKESEDDMLPTWREHPRDVDVVIGDVAHFICDAEAGSSWQINWILPGKATKHIKLYRRRQILEIDEVHDYHEGTYTCVISNKNGQYISAEARLTIIETVKAQITFAPPADDNMVKEHADLEMRCSASGRPRPQISWLWQEETLSKHLVSKGRYVVRSFASGAELPPLDAIAIRATNGFIVSMGETLETNSYLLIRNVTERDARGRYICYASNRLGSSRVSTVIRVISKQSHEGDLQEQKYSQYSTKDMMVNGTTSLTGENLLRHVIDKARIRIEAAIKKTAERLRDHSRGRTSADVNALFRQPSRAALELAKAAEIYEAAIDEVTSILRQRGQQMIQLNESDPEGKIITDRRSEPRISEALGVKLTSDQLAIISQLSGCTRSSDIDACSRHLCFHLNYRSIDGTCNNFNHPRWGAALEPLKRLLPPQYENGINTPIGWTSTRLYYGFPKPSPRLVSRELLGNVTLLKKIESRLREWNNLLREEAVLRNRTMDSGEAEFISVASERRKNFEKARQNIERYQEKFGEIFDEDGGTSGMLMQWGQFLDHDLDFSPVDASISRYSDGLNCNETCMNDPPCFPILVPPGDPRIRHRCIGFSRSSATCGSGSTSILLGQPHHREQLNQITSFIDASNVYGSDDLENSRLRETLHDEGKMWQGVPTPSGKRLLPYSITGLVDCQMDPQQDFVPCFKAGDHRSNENLGLLSLHTLWVREHNRLADGLRSLNPEWTGDRVYQEARKIVGACMQAITYEEWLPRVLGPEGYKLLGTYHGYDDQIDASIANEFSTAAMRFGHTMVPPVVYRLGEDWQPIKEGHLLLHQAFFAPDRLLRDGGMDPIIRGLLFNGIRDRTKNPPMNPELTERLFAMAHELALDLASLNIQRGRDHGIPGYTEYAFRFCGNVNASLPETFEELRPRMQDDQTIERLRRVYGHPGNIDLFAGGALEVNLPEARVGPTFACILANQFKRLRDGDRFWYEAPGVFTSAQLAEIKRAGTSLARIVCEDSDNITHVPKNAFMRPTQPDDLVDCKVIPKLNLAAWVECEPTIKVTQPIDTARIRRQRSVFSEETTVQQGDGSCSAAKIGTCAARDLYEKISQLEKQVEELKSQTSNNG
ncbi:unnamed protein product [Calicophoron daubneyi]|uniref:Ig-like domain-containing protein n=1 Tax=Calicophoron daubneyi TaxID=300641 RepID=A0AAV2THJ2_CALDB